MCGILCKICSAGVTSPKDERVWKRIKNRGPDCFNSLEISPVCGTNIIFCGAVLWMQGATLTPQPLDDDNGILLYNGDIFDETWTSDLSDTQVIMDKLSQHSEQNAPDYSITETIKSLKGPYSLIYYSKKSNQLYFARDRIGRSTMLVYKDNDSIIISSVLGREYPCIEVPATHIYCLDIVTQKLKLYAWNKLGKTIDYELDDWLKNVQLQQTLPDDEFKFDFDQKSIEIEDEVAISLYYMTCENLIKFIETTAKETKDKCLIMNNLMKNEKINATVLKVTKLLEKSVEIRLKTQPNRCKNCLLEQEIECNHCTVGILFSGGLDCTVLALLADKYLPIDQNIDLINVAFSKDEESSFEVPDRLTGRQSYEELKKICPLRKWEFREVNIGKKELENCQIDSIADLVYPRQTILDESLGSALWFAARGQDELSVSSCRVLLLGSGADELFGGYTRHRNAFKRKGWTGLAQELSLDWNRISYRNLSRDNRVICDHGRQPRMPYLDEDFTSFVLQLKPWLKCFPSENLGLGIGDKLMLRLVALNIGLTGPVVLPKRALQFGSRIANKKEKGCDISQRFLVCK